MNLEIPTKMARVSITQSTNHPTRGDQTEEILVLDSESTMAALVHVLTHESLAIEHHDDFTAWGQPRLSPDGDAFVFSADGRYNLTATHLGSAYGPVEEV
jgi:hypothetical protein